MCNIVWRWNQPFCPLREVSTLQRFSSIGKSTFVTLKLVHYSEVSISIVFLIHSVLYQRCHKLNWNVINSTGLVSLKDLILCRVGARLPAFVNYTSLCTIHHYTFTHFKKMLQQAGKGHCGWCAYLQETRTKRGPPFYVGALILILMTSVLQDGQW